jgi:hypothetical protein
MQIALKKGQDLPPHKLAFSSKQVLRLQKFLSQFEHNIHLYRHALSSQNRRSREYNEILRKAKIYLTHFIRVMNMAIFRGELPSETRKYYGLATNEVTVPPLNSENELMSCGKRMIEGEESRIRKGGNPITNPTIAVVKVRLEKFNEEYTAQHELEKKTYEYMAINNNLRKEADDIILQIWNEVEKTHSAHPEERRKKLNEDYGLVYYYRKNELENIRIMEAKSQ